MKRKVKPPKRSTALRRFRAELFIWEDRYGFDGDEAHRAIDRGDLEEDWDVCNWLLTWNRYKAIQGEPA